MRHLFFFLIKSTLIFFLILPQFSFAETDLEQGVVELAKQISNNMQGNNKKKIAVIEFSNLNDEISAFGQFLSEELITQLYMQPDNKFEVVERRQLMKVLDEQGLGTSGLLDSDAMSRVGKILGVDAIVTGSITDLGNSVKVNARMISVSTGKIFAVASEKIAKVSTVTQLMARTNHLNNAKKAEKVKPTKNVTTSSAPQSTQVVTVKSMKIELDGCKKEGDTVTCRVFATSLSEDLNVLIISGYYASFSRIMDNIGRESRSNKAAVGRKHDEKYFWHTFVQGIPTPIDFSFNKVASDAVAISLFQARFRIGQNDKFDAKFRNIAL